MVGLLLPPDTPCITLSYYCYYMALVLPALVFLKVVISVVDSGLLCCTWVSTVCAVIIPLTPNDLYMSRTAPLTSKRCILYIYSTNVGTEYFKHALYSPFSPHQNAVCFIMLTCLVRVLFTFYIQGVLKLKKIIPAPKG